MASLNRVMVIGNLGDDPEVRSTGAGQSVATLRLATNERWNDKEGKPQERTEWHRIIAWGKLAEQCKEFLSKGRQIFAEGRLQTREWTDKEGHKRYTTEIIAQKIVFLGSRGDGGGGGSRGSSAGSSSGSYEPSSSGMSDSAGGPPPDDDIPF